MQREKKYCCNLEEFKEKMNTLVGIKENIKSLIPSLLIKLFQVLSPMDVGRVCPRNTLNSRVILFLS